MTPEIEQVVDDQPAIDRHVDPFAAGDRETLRRIEKRIVRYGGPIAFPLAHPDPDQRILFGDRKTPHPRFGRNFPIGMRIEDTAAIGGKAQAVISAIPSPTRRPMLSAAKRCGQISSSPCARARFTHRSGCRRPLHIRRRCRLERRSGPPSRISGMRPPPRRRPLTPAGRRTKDYLTRFESTVRPRRNARAHHTPFGPTLGSF